MASCGALSCGIFVALVAILGALLMPYSGISERTAAYLQPSTWAVIAGGSDGLGEAWARTLAGRGVNLVLLARRAGPLEDLAAELRKGKGNFQVVPLQCDLGNLSASFVSEKVLKGRDVRLLVYNAASTGPKGSFLRGDIEGAMVAHDVNVRGVALFTHLVGSDLRARKVPGGIVLMSSMAGMLGTAWVANYAATKAYITAFAHGLFHELRPLGVDVVSCVAGATVTPTYLKSLGTVETRKTFIEQGPDEVAEECLAALGRTASVATGPLNKFVRWVFTRLLSPTAAVSIFSEQTGQQMGFTAADL